MHKVRIALCVSLVYSNVTRIGGQMVSFAGGARYYLETPGEGPD
jgi:hypothetical protein